MIFKKNSLCFLVSQSIWLTDGSVQCPRSYQVLPRPHLLSPQASGQVLSRPRLRSPQASQAPQASPSQHPLGEGPPAFCRPHPSQYHSFVCGTGPQPPPYDSHLCSPLHSPVPIWTTPLQPSVQPLDPLGARPVLSPHLHLSHPCLFFFHMSICTSIDGFSEVLHIIWCSGYIWVF